MLNKTLLHTVTLVSLLAITPTAWADHDSSGNGNGGDVVFCRGENGKLSATLLDYYEAHSRDIKLDLGGPELSVRQKVDLVLDRLSAHSPKRVEAYKQRAEPFISDIEQY